MKTIKQSNRSESAARWIRLNSLVVVLVSLFGAATTSHAWFPCSETSTNGLAGEMYSSRARLAAIHAAARRPSTVAHDWRSAAYRSWWELKDSVRYGLPDMIRNERPTLVLAGLGLATLIWIAFRSRLQPPLKAARLENHDANGPLKATRINT